MGINLVGQSAPLAVAATTGTVTYSSHAGNTLVLAVLHQAGAVTSIVDTAGNTWTVGPDSTTDGAVAQKQVKFYYCLTAAAITSLVITMGASSGIDAFLIELSDVGSYRGGAHMISSATNPGPCNVVGVQARDFVIGALAYFEATAGTKQDTLTTGLGYTETTRNDTLTTHLSGAYSQRTTIGDSGPTWVMSTGSTGFATVAFAPIPPIGTGQLGTPQSKLGLMQLGTVGPPTAAAFFGGSGTLGVGQAQTVPAAVAMSGAGTMGVGQSQTGPAAVALTGAGTLSVAGTQTEPAAVALAGAGTLGVAGTDTEAAAVAMSGSGTLSVTASQTEPGVVALTGAGAIGVAAAVTGVAAVAMTGAGTTGVAGAARPAVPSR